MDLHLIPHAEPTAAEREAIDAVIPGAGTRHEARGHLLLPALQAAQSTAGQITAGALNHICRHLDVPPAEAYGVASFYHLLTTEPAPPLHICDDIVCRISGTPDLIRRVRSPHRLSPCLGHCERAPAAFLSSGNGHTVAPASAVETPGPAAGPTLARNHRRPTGTPSAPQTCDPAQRVDLRLLKRAGHADPASLDEYLASGGYGALRKALAGPPASVIEEVIASRLVGRGGAAFPTGRKWQAVAEAPRQPHYLVCNADESEPGTFKDRVLMEEDPFALVEAMTVAAYATGCLTGYVYVRGEYPLAYARLHTAVEAARMAGYLGNGVFGSDFSFDLILRRGAGAYICGEETALFNSIEGRRGEPRNKPPFPTQSGLFGMPTLVNNVETLLNVLDIVERGAEAFAETGTEGSTGTKLFCVSGCVARPGVYEVPFGTTLHQLLNLAEHPGNIQAILLGGAAGTFLTQDDLDLPLTFEDTRAAGASLGSGAIIVFDETVDLRDTIRRIARFFREESCGQCVPCRVGTQRLEEAVGRLSDAVRVSQELPLIQDIAQAMRDASICGLGQTAPAALQSAIARGLIR